MMADKALDIIRNDMTEDEYEAYKIVRNNWDMEKDSVECDELWNTLIDSRLN